MRNFLLSATMVVTGLSAAFLPAVANAEDAGFGETGVFVPYETFNQLSQEEQDALVTAGEAAESSEEVAAGGAGCLSIPRNSCGGTYYYWDSGASCCKRRRKNGPDDGGNA